MRGDLSVSQLSDFQEAVQILAIYITAALRKRRQVWKHQAASRLITYIQREREKETDDAQGGEQNRTE